MLKINSVNFTNAQAQNTNNTGAIREFGNKAKEGLKYLKSDEYNKADTSTKNKVKIGLLAGTVVGALLNIVPKNRPLRTLGLIVFATSQAIFTSLTKSFDNILNRLQAGKDVQNTQPNVNAAVTDKFISEK